MVKSLSPRAMLGWYGTRTVSSDPSNVRALPKRPGVTFGTPLAAAWTQWTELSGVCGPVTGAAMSWAWVFWLLNVHQRAGFSLGNLPVAALVISVAVRARW